MAAAKQTRAKQARAKQAPAKKTRAKRARANKRPTKPRATTTSTSRKPARVPYRTIADYLVGVAANLGLGLERSLDMNVDMYAYELHDELVKLNKEAAQALAAGDVAQIRALAASKGVTLDAPAVETMLRALAAAERYDPIEE